jgi:hypothetical protein
MTGWWSLEHVLNSRALVRLTVPEITTSFLPPLKGQKKNLGTHPILFGINIANFKIVKLGVRVIRKGYEPIKKGRFN